MIACTWFLTRVRCLTRCVRRITSRHSILVRSSATHVPGKKSAASNWARILASTLSVFTFGSAIARVLPGLETTTRRTSGRSNVAIASELVVPRARPHRRGEARPPTRAALPAGHRSGPRHDRVRPRRSRSARTTDEHPSRSTSPLAPLSARLWSRNRPGGSDRNGFARSAVGSVAGAANPTGRVRQRWSNRWKPALNAFAVTFEGRIEIND
jgi:hypothetical protein